MIVEPVGKSGAYYIVGNRHEDNRGEVNISYLATELRKEMRGNDGTAGATTRSVRQQTITRSVPGAFRGIHFSPYAKLVTCVSGNITDIVCYARGSRGRYAVDTDVVQLGGGFMRSVYIPPGVGHAFFSEDYSVVSYLSWGEWNADTEITVNAVSEEVRASITDHLIDSIAAYSPKDVEAETFSILTDATWERINTYQLMR